MFSDNLYRALCQSSAADTNAHPAVEDDRTMVEAIQRALDTYQRLFSQNPPSAD